MNAWIETPCNHVIWPRGFYKKKPKETCYNACECQIWCKKYEKNGYTPYTIHRFSKLKWKNTMKVWFEHQKLRNMMKYVCVAEIRNLPYERFFYFFSLWNLIKFNSETNRMLISFSMTHSRPHQTIIYRHMEYFDRICLN